MNSSMKHNLKSVLMILTFIIAGGVFLYYFNRGNDEMNTDGLNSITFDFSGEVSYQIPIVGSYGIIGLDLDSSSISSYDPRNKKDQYFCIIKSSKAELVLTDIYIAKKKNKMKYDHRLKLLFVYDYKDSLLRKIKPRFYSFTGRNKSLKAHHRL